MKKLLCSCNAMKKFAGVGYWEETCVEKLAVYDSMRLMPKRFIQGQKSMVFMTDSTNERVCAIIWGDSCDFKPGEMIYVKHARSHAPGTGTAYWKPYLINKDEQLTYIIYR